MCTLRGMGEDREYDKAVEQEPEGAESRSAAPGAQEAPPAVVVAQGVRGMIIAGGFDDSDVGAHRLDN
ncbi:MAG: hypothetical protein H0U55_13290 [Rubrobacteraceae bacterium]|nr:hypothetical protein [Rubrobacteraceae bacterium]